MSEDLIIGEVLLLANLVVALVSIWRERSSHADGLRNWTAG
ncbi:MAG: hypothetical protein ABH852_04915 [Methanobacteriota archaeon]